jgi:hypothetical protein
MMEISMKEVDLCERLGRLLAAGPKEFGAKLSAGRTTGRSLSFVLLIHSKVSRSVYSERAFIFKDTEQAETFITEFVDELPDSQILGGNDYVNLRVSGQTSELVAAPIERQAGWYAGTQRVAYLVQCITV